MNVIEVRGLTKSFGDRKVVDDVSLTVEKGEIAGFLGAAIDGQAPGGLQKLIAPREIGGASVGPPRLA